MADNDDDRFAEEPWTVPGVPHEAREAARIAARRASLSLGGWLTQTIMGQASSELRGGGRSPDPGAGAPLPTPVTVGKIMESIQGLAERIEDSERRAAKVLAPMGERILGIEQELEALRSASVPPTAHLERAIARLSERVEQLIGDDEPAGARRGFWSRRD